MSSSSTLHEEGFTDDLNVKAIGVNLRSPIVFVSSRSDVSLCHKVKMKNEKDVELIVYAPRIAMMLLDYKDVKELSFEGVTEAKKNTRYAPGLRCEVDRITLFKQENGEKMKNPVLKKFVDTTYSSLSIPSGVKIWEMTRREFYYKVYNAKHKEICKFGQ